MTTTIVYTHTYAYRFWARGFLPILSVQLFFGKKAPILITTLLDSGCAYPVFNADVATRLGIDIATLPPEKMVGLGGKQVVYRQKLGLQFGPLLKPVECEVRFAKDLPFNLLGRAGVFNHVQIGFDEANRKIHMALNA